MTERTTTRTFDFRHPFALPGVDGILPAGTYVLETDEEAIPGLSFVAYRRVRSTLAISGWFGGSDVRQVATIDPKDLDAVLALDARVR